MIAEAHHQRDPLVPLCRVKNSGVNCPPVPLGWNLSIGRRQDRDGLLWLVCPEKGGRIPAETSEAIQRKIALFREKNPEHPIHWHEYDGHFEGLVSPLVEGEQIAHYLRNRKGLSQSTGYSLLRLMLAEISRWADTPALLASIRAEDFLVSLSYGVKVRVVLSLGCSFLREPRYSDEAALQWHCISLISEVYRAMRHTEGANALTDRNRMEKPFKKIERRWKAGKWKTIDSLLIALDKVIRKLGTSSKRNKVVETSALLFATRPEVRPKGMVTRFLCEGFRKSYPEKLSDGDAVSSLAPFSTYVLLAKNPQSESSRSLRYAYLLPPEGWLVDGFVNEANQKLRHPFLSEFEGTTRFRAVYSEERFTAVMGDAERGLPVPMYGYLTTIRGDQVILILRRLLDILDVMESEGVARRLSTPWQLQIHRENSSVDRDGSQAPWNHSLETWGGWSLKVRTEIPTEQLIADPSGIVWNWIYEALEGKFLPALASWLLSLQDIRDDETPARIQQRGFHPVPELQSLFDTSRQFLNENIKEHRHRFVDLLEEGLLVTR